MLCKCGCGFEAGFKKSGKNCKERMFLNRDHRLNYYASHHLKKSDRVMSKILYNPELKEIFKNIRLCRKKSSQLIKERENIINETIGILLNEKKTDSQFRFIDKKYSMEMRLEI